MANRTHRRPAVKHDASRFCAENFLLSALDSHVKKTASTLFDTETKTAAEQSFIAIDEVGRGCVAGPVVVCATLWSMNQNAKAADIFTRWVGNLRDSKKMTASAREAAFELALKEEWIRFDSDWSTPPEQDTVETLTTLRAKLASFRLPRFQVKWSGQELKEHLQDQVKQLNESAQPELRGAYLGSADAQIIDRFGIIQALGLAATRALDQIPRQPLPSVIFFDGHRPLALSAQWELTPQVLITKGDDLLKTISASSVIAKVTRDRWMEKYSEVFDGYHFEEHRGYGTEKHRQAIAERGPSPLHRLSFLKNFSPESCV